MAIADTIKDETGERPSAAEDRPPGQLGDVQPAPGRGFGPTANILLGYTLVKGLQLSLYNLIFPLYAYSLGYDQAVIGQLNAVGALTVLVVSIPLGLLADRFGRARTLALSGVLLPPMLVLIALAQSLPLLIAGIILQNAVATIYWSTTSALLVGTVPQEQRVRAFALNSFLLWSLGALGSVIGGFVVAAAARALDLPANATEPFRIALLASAAITLVGGLPLWRLREGAATAAREAERARFQLADLRHFARLLVPDALQAFGAGAVVGFIPLFFALRFELPPGQIGFVFALNGLLSGASILIAPRLSRRLGDVRAISAVQLSIALAIGLTVASPVLAGAVGAEAVRAGLLAIVSAIYTPFAMGSVAARWRGTLGGLYNVTYATGFSLGPLLSGWLQVHYGFGPAFAMAAGSLLLAAATMWLFFGRRATGNHGGAGRAAQGEG